MDVKPIPSSVSKIPLDVLKTPFCGDLRSKKFYMRNEIITTEEEFVDQSGHTWCYHTQMGLGPDGGRAAPSECGPDRKCYRSAVSEPTQYSHLPNTRINRTRIA